MNVTKFVYVGKVSFVEQKELLILRSAQNLSMEDKICFHHKKFVEGTPPH